MRLFDRIVMLASGSTVRKRLVSRFSWEQERADHLAPHIAQLRRAGYDSRLGELGKALGLGGDQQLTNADVIAGIRKDSRGVAFSVLHTHNDDLRATVAAAMGGSNPPSQRELSSTLRAWEKDRAAWKSDQITQTETAAGYDQALRDVLDRNAFSLDVHIEPRDAVCDRCQALIDAGTVPADEAEPCPIHPNCVHAWKADAKSLRAQAQDRGSVWLGGEDEISLADVAVRGLLVRTDAALERPRRDALRVLDNAWAQFAERVAS